MRIIKMSMKLSNMKSNYIGTPDAWKEFIQRWSAKRIELNLDEHDVRIPSYSDQLEISKEIQHIELSLGLNLPNSYKDFILATNSQVPAWLLSGFEDYFALPIEKVNWLHTMSPALVYEAYAEDHDVVISDEDYYVYSKEQDGVNLRREYLPYCLRLNYHRGGWEDANIILLNSKEITVDREMESWCFYPYDGYAIRFPSFASLVVSRYILDVAQFDYETVFGLEDDPYGFSRLLLE